MNRIQVALLVGLFALLEACASTFQAKPENQSNFFEHNAKFGFPADAVVPHVHARSEVNWSKYNKVQLRPIVIDNGFASQVGRGKEEELTLLAKSFYEMLSERLSQDYVMVEEPAPGAMSIQLIIKHAEPSWIAPQVLSKVSWQLQALNSVVRFFRGKPAFAGEITIEFSVHDSLTGEWLFAGMDRRVGGAKLVRQRGVQALGRCTKQFRVLDRAISLPAVPGTTRIELLPTESIDPLSRAKGGIMRNEEAAIVLPELEDPVCCSKVQEPNHGLPETTIGYLYEDYGVADNE